MTHADEIRAMNDEEMARKFSETLECPAIFGGYRIVDEDCRDFSTCKDCWLDWLKQEVKK